MYLKIYVVLKFGSASMVGQFWILFYAMFVKSWEPYLYRVYIWYCKYNTIFKIWFVACKLKMKFKTLKKNEFLESPLSSKICSGISYIPYALKVDRFLNPLLIVA